MNKNEYPEIFINTLDKLSRIMVKDLNMKIIYEDIITKFLNTLPREYDALAYMLQVKMDNEVLVTLNNLKEQVRSKYQHLKKQDNTGFMKMFLEK